MTNTRAFGVCAVIAAAACWGLATVMSKAALDDFPPFFLLTVQLTASVAFLWTAVLITGQRAPANKQSLRAAATGVLEPAAAYALGLAGLALTTAAETSVLGATETVFIVVLAWIFLGERASAAGIAAVVAAFAGAAIINLPGEDAEWGGRFAGNMLVVAATFTAAVYVVISSRLVANIAPLPLVALQQSAGLICALFFLAGARALDWEPPLQMPGARALAFAAAAGVVQFALAFWFYLLGLRLLPANTAGLFLTLIPVFGVGGAMLFLGETLTILQWFGCALILAATVHTARRGAL